MNTVETLQILSTSSADTELIGEKIGRGLRGGEVIELVSDVGGGKTTFTRGLARGAGSTEVVGSPTFTVGREYATKKLKILHYDFYRLNDPGIIADELKETIGYQDSVVVVEWSDIVQDVLPKNRIQINFLPQENPDERKIVIKYTEQYKYLCYQLEAKS